MNVQQLSSYLALLLSATLLTLAACSPSQTPSGGPVPSSGSNNAPAAATTAPQDIKVGAVFSMTKAGAVYGDVQKKAVEMAFDEINKAGGVNGSKLQAIFEDDASDAKQAITVFQKLINQDKVVAIIGPTLSNSALSSDPVAQEAKVPVLAVSNTAGGIVEIGNFIFRDSLSEAQVIPQTVKVAKEKLNLQKVALLYANDDAFSKGGYDVFKAALQANNVQILTEETFGTADVDFTPQLTKVKGMNPDAIVVSALVDPASRIIEQKSKLGIADSVRVIGGNGFNSPAIIKNTGKASEGTIVGAAWHISNEDPMNQEFIKNYKARNNADPDQFAAQAYAGAYIMADALKRAGANPTGDKVREALVSTKLKTVLGDFSFTPERNANHTPVVQEVKDGKFALLK